MAEELPPAATAPWRPFPDGARVEDARLVRGQGRFVANLRPHGVNDLHAGFVRSAYARAVIKSINVEAAANHPGVFAVLTADDLELADIESGIEGLAMGRPILAKRRVSHVGEAIALVLAASETAVVDAVELVEVMFAPETPTIDALSAVHGEPIHSGAESNIVAVETVGNSVDGWNRAEIEIELDLVVKNQRLAPVTLEPLSVLAIPATDAQLPLQFYVGHQTPHFLKRQLGRWFETSIEVIVPDVGGGYGLKARLFPEYVAIIAAAHRFGRAIRWLQSRSEQFLIGTHGRDMVHKIRIGGDQSGLIHRMHIDFVLAVGAYPHLGAMVADFTRLVSPELYSIEDFSVTSTVVVTNTAPIAPYRGAGRPEAAYAMERAVDAYARAIGMEPIDVRYKNLLRPTAWPHTTATNAHYDSGDYQSVLDKAVEQIDVASIRSKQQKSLDRYRRASLSRTDFEQGTNTTGPESEMDSYLDDVDHLIGLGFGVWVERSGGATDTGEFARVTATPDGRLEVLTGSTSNGQGHETVWAQVAGQAFDFDSSLVGSHVTVVAGDTSRVPRGSGSSASRSAQLGASAVWRCSHRLQRTLGSVAAAMLEAAPSDLTIRRGRYSVKGSPSSALELADVVVEATEAGVDTSDEEWYVAGEQAFPYGVHAAVVEVDPETGFVSLRRYVAVDDCGVVLHPEMVEGQVVGSIAQGVGQALFEQVVYGLDGQMLTGTLLDYTVPGATDLPSTFETSNLVSPAPSNTLGVKGAGEGGCIGAPPAIVNAVLDALAPLGVTQIDMPLYPEKVWLAIRAAQTTLRTAGY